MKNKKFNIYSSFTKAVDEDKGVITVEGWASKAYENGKPIIDRDNEHVLTSTLDISECKIMLAQHDWDRPIGKLELSHRPEGVWLKGQIFRDMDSVTFAGVKNGVLDSFSIGFTARDYEYIQVDGEDILQLKDGSIHEVSIVTIPANVKATMQSVKSATTMKGSIDSGLQCSVAHIKSMNPDIECQCETKGKNMEKKSIQEIIKGLTFEETENQTWNQYDMLNKYISILAETIQDNFFEAIWEDDITKEQAKANVMEAINSFIKKLDEIDTLKVDVEVQKGKQENMIINKETDIKSEEGQEESTEGVEETQEENVIEETPSSESPEDTEVSVGDKETNSEEVDDNKADEVVEEIPAEVEPKLIGNAQTTIGYLSTVDVDSLSVEEIEALYDTADLIMDKIESYVREDLSGEED